ncbi:MAG: 30S ribosomal protein S4 [Rickettsiales bacterium]|jgi:small subunit ribosomal protein S4|nr:30S ribosomal protein S4 [Rickettsiales bacterium]
MARAGAKRSTRKLKIGRSLGVNLWGQAKSPFNKRKYKPGQHGPTSRGGSNSDYAKQLRAKQTLKGYYGNIGEKKFHKYYDEANNMKGDAPQNLIGLLESRLDAVVYRAKLAPTVFAARQLVSHGHVMVNGKRVKISSYAVKPGDEITVSEKAKQMPLVVLALESAERGWTDYVKTDSANFTATFVRVPAFEDVPYPVQMSPELIVEYYSR